MQRLESEVERLRAEAGEARTRLRVAESTAAMAERLREEAEGSNTCVICFDKPANTVLMPCMHSRFCGECMRRHRTTSGSCPTCRGNIMGVLDIFR
jgi:molybdenum cofactor biosynthesis enzyme MoaA